MGNKILLGSVAAMVGLFASPMILSLLKIQPSEGFGMDDIVTALVIASAFILVDKVL